MSDEINHQPYGSTAPIGGYANEKDEKADYSVEPTQEVTSVEEDHVKGQLEMTAEDLDEAEAKMSTMPLDRCYGVVAQVYGLHQHDQNFPGHALDRIGEFLANKDAIMADPGQYHEIVTEMKLEAILVTENSPYAEVRGVVDNTDDPTMPSFTFRVWVLGILLSGAGAFINQLFSIRNPSVYVTSNVAQLLAFPMGKLMSVICPRKEFTLFGRSMSLNPGPFNRKEHMLITIMATVAFNTPYTGNIILVQALPVYFNQAYAYNFGYQLMCGIGSNFVGYGLAGLCRKFLVQPSFCIWPTALVTIALNKAFHGDNNEAVKGPFGRTYNMSRYKFFLVAFTTMFIYWWFPGYIFGALSYFNWLTWISPNNTTLANLTGSISGLGINPWPTFDFNPLTVYQWVPLVIPWFTIWNQFIGMIISGFMIIGLYWTNAWNTGYLPINSNKVFANDGTRYNVSYVLDSESHFDNEGYQAYSEPWMAAGNLVVYFWFFAVYSATVSYTFLYHRHEIALGARGLTRVWRKRYSKKYNENEEDLADDVHMRLMRVYPDVPEWWYMIVLAVAAAIGMAALGAWPTFTTPATVVYGIVLAIIFVVPVGLIFAVTGVQVTLNVLAEFIGGTWVAGNATAMNYFKMYGYITTAQAVYFLNDLKLAHYTKIPPKHTFLAQMIATMVSTLVCTAVFNFQMGFKDVCTPDATFGLTCPGINTFFTAAVFWGTIGPPKLFGAEGRYKALLIGFPVGFVMPFMMWGLTKAFPRYRWLRQLHPVMICIGGIQWAPYNLSNYWPTVVITYISWVYIKKRYLGFWSKYNYVLAAAWMAAIALAAVVIFFGLQIPAVELDWWGNDVSYAGCDSIGCRRLEIPDVGYFGAAPGTYV